MQTHHYLGALPKIGETLQYEALWRDQWIALLSFSAPAWKCAPQDRWIGWTFRLQYDRLKLISNSSRFLILPEWHRPNLASCILSLCQRRLNADWQNSFGHPLLLLETFVDPPYFQVTLYEANNWLYVGNTKGSLRPLTPPKWSSLNLYTRRPKLSYPNRPLLLPITQEVLT